MRRFAAAPERVTTDASIPGSGVPAAPGFHFVDTGQRRHEYRTGFGLPPGVHDWALAAADVFAIPLPFVSVHGSPVTEQSERREVVLLHVVVAVLPHGRNRRRRSIEHVNGVLLDELPQAVVLGVVRCAVVQYCRRSERERAVDDVGVAGNPADVCRTPVGVFGLDVEDGGRSRRRVRGSRRWCV